jgi:hypothetical protein
MVTNSEVEPKKHVPKVNDRTCNHVVVAIHVRVLHKIFYGSKKGFFAGISTKIYF